MPFTEAVVLIGFYIIGMPMVYIQARATYKWQKKWCLVLSLGGFPMAIWVMYDIWMHTSMMGAYTRDWKKNPEPGTRVVKWKDLKDYKVVDQSTEEDNS